MDNPNTNQGPLSQETVDKGKETAQLAKETVKSAAADTRSWASEQADRAKETVRSRADETGERAAQTVDRGRLQAAGALDRAADKIRQTGPRIPGGQKTTDLANRTAQTLESTAGYLRRTDARAMASNVKETVRRHPTQALVGALFAGFLMGRAMRRH